MHWCFGGRDDCDGNGSVGSATQEAWRTEGMTLVGCSSSMVVICIEPNLVVWRKEQRVPKTVKGPSILDSG